ncbi:ASCH domain-containing protein [Myceligenerans crystallogenes]|uniref:ASCH domain-containing protein n=1 Tax=Myceligenerans crystallogenes TaxID=316335 RepID=A0ABN2NQV1_9MICO
MSDETREPGTNDVAEPLDGAGTATAGEAAGKAVVDEAAADETAGGDEDLPDELAEDDEDDDFDPAAVDPGDFAYDSDEDDDVAAAVQDFWEMVRPYAGMAKTGVVTGVLASETVPPPAWAFGEDPQQADDLLDLVLDGTKTATSSAAWDYEDAGEPLPEAGELSILLDGSGQPRALIRSTSVEILPFDEIDDDIAEAEGEGDATLESWRADHESFFRRYLSEGREFAPDMPIVVERFEVLYPS